MALTNKDKEEQAKRLEQLEAELDNPNDANTPTKQDQDDNPNDAEEITTVADEDEGSDHEESEGEGEPSDAPKETEVPQESVDYKKKFKNSTREALIQKNRNDKLLSSVDDALTYTPTLEELQDYSIEMGKEYSELNTFEKNMLRKSLISDVQSQKIKEIAAETKQAKVWAKKVDTFADAEDVLVKLNNDSKGFKKFAMNSNRWGTDMGILLSAYLHETGSKKPTRSKGSMLLDSGAGKASPTKAKFTEDDAILLRKKNPRKYKEYLKKGLIDIEI